MKKTFITVLLLLTAFVVHNNFSVSAIYYTNPYFEKESHPDLQGGWTTSNPYDNNSIEHAEYLGEMSPFCYYSCSSFDEVTIYGTISHPDAYVYGDFFAFFVEEKSTVELYMTNPDGENYNLFLYEVPEETDYTYSGAMIASSVNSGDATESISVELETGIYYARVDALTTSDYDYDEQYTLRIRVEAVPIPAFDPYVLEEEKGYLWCDNDIKEYSVDDSCQSFESTINGLYMYDDIPFVDGTNPVAPYNHYLSYLDINDLYADAYQLDGRATDQMFLYNKESVLVYGFFTEALYREINSRLNDIEDDIERVDLGLKLLNTGVYVLEVFGATATGGATLLLFTIDTASMADIYEDYLIDLYILNNGTYLSYTYQLFKARMELSDDFSGDINGILAGKYYNYDMLTILERYLSYAYLEGMDNDLDKARDDAYDAAINWGSDDVFVITVNHTYNRGITYDEDNKEVPRGLSTRMNTLHIRSNTNGEAYSNSTLLDYYWKDSNGKHNIDSYNTDINVTKTTSRMMQFTPDVTAPEVSFKYGNTVTIYSNRTFITSLLVSYLQPELYFNNRPAEFEDYNYYYSTMSSVNKYLYNVAQPVTLYVKDYTGNTNEFIVYVIVKKYVAPTPTPPPTDPKPICIKGICII